MAATTSSTSLNSQSPKQSHSHHPFILFLFLISSAVLACPTSMAASEPPHRSFIQLELESTGRRDDCCFESVALLQVKSGMKSVLKNPPRKLWLESESRKRRDEFDRRFESDARTERSSNITLRKLRSEEESNGRKRRGDRRFESVAQQVLSRTKPSSNIPQRKQRLESESNGRQRRGYRRFESVALRVSSGVQELISNYPPRKLRLELESRRRRRRNYRRFESVPLEVPNGRTNRAKSESGGKRRRYNRRFESAEHEVPSGPNPISN